MDATTRLALRVNWRNLALGHPTFTADGATFVVDRAHPAIRDANFVFDVTAATAEVVDRLLARMRSEFAHCPTITIRLDPGMAPALEARLALEGVERSGTLVMVLDGELRGPEPAHAIRPAASDADWLSITELKRADWREHAPKLGKDPTCLVVPDGLAAVARLKCPPARYVLATIEDRPVGFCQAWEGVDGMGQVEDLFVLPAFRRRGIATALIRRCAAEARTRGAGPLVICADPTDSPKTLYAAMGWRPVAVCRQYGLDARRAT
jgi:GNAT superfamily N-acetyltransferase